MLCCRPDLKIRHDDRGSKIILFGAPMKGSRRRFNFRMLGRFVLRLGRLRANVLQC
jgi:hypothetical protein